MHCLYLVALAVASAANAPPVAAPSVDAKLAGAPVEFRCDSMAIFTKPNRNVCRGNVVIRRGDMVVCCDVFEGIADEAWAWQRFSCNKDVRAQRGVETVWAERAEFLQQENDLILTGRPVLHRGDSILEGERVVIDVREDHARILKPRGRINADAPKLPSQPAPMPAGPLPAVCPLPALRR